MKEQHEREREEARIALEKVHFLFYRICIFIYGRYLLVPLWSNMIIFVQIERTVEFEQNRYILEELERLAGYNGGAWGAHFRSPLERLGLFIKEEYSGEVDEMEEGEEGEIL